MSNPQHTKVMLDALQGYKQKNGQPSVRALLERVAGVSAASQVPENRMQAVVSACVENKTFERGSAKNLSGLRGVESLAEKAYASWNNSAEREQAN
jgi:hypothetical protein